MSTKQPVTLCDMANLIRDARYAIDRIDTNRELVINDTEMNLKVINALQVLQGVKETPIFRRRTLPGFFEQGKGVELC